MLLLIRRAAQQHEKPIVAYEHPLCAIWVERALAPARTDEVGEAREYGARGVGWVGQPPLEFGAVPFLAIDRAKAAGLAHALVVVVRPDQAMYIDTGHPLQRQHDRVSRQESVDFARAAL